MEVDGGKKGGQEKETGEKQRRANDAGGASEGVHAGISEAEVGEPSCNPV